MERIFLKGTDIVNCILSNLFNKKKIQLLSDPKNTMLLDISPGERKLVYIATYNCLLIVSISKCQLGEYLSQLESRIPYTAIKKRNKSHKDPTACWVSMLLPWKGQLQRVYLKPCPLSNTLKMVQVWETDEWLPGVRNVSGKLTRKGRTWDISVATDLPWLCLIKHNKMA